MKKLIFPIALGLIFISTASMAMADDRDDITCSATVTWNNNVYKITETEDSMYEIVKDIVDEACDRACKHVKHGDDSCEHQCEKEAKIADLICSDDFDPEDAPANPIIVPRAK